LDNKVTDILGAWL